MTIARRAARFALPLLLLLAALVAAALRLWHIDRAPFWLDEAYSGYAADHGWRFLWTMVPRYETHPPVYYSMVHLWSLGFGETLMARRMLGVVAGLAAVAVGTFASQRLARLVDPLRWRLATAAAALMFALQPLMIEMSRQVRPYPVMTLVYAIGIVGLVRIARDTADRVSPSRRALVVVAGAEALMCWLHSLGPLYGGSLALGLAIVALRRGLSRADWAWLIGCQIAIALIYLPGALILADQSSGWIKATWLKFHSDKLLADLGRIYATWQRPAMAAMALLVLLALGRLIADRRGRRIAVALLLLAVLPVAASLAITLTVSPVFIYRTLAPCTVPVILIAAMALEWGSVAARAWAWALRGIALLALAALLLSMSVRSWDLANWAPVQDWYGAARYLSSQATPGAVVWAYPNEGALPLAYAWRDLGIKPVPVVPIPAPVPAIGVGGYYPTGSRGVVTLYPAEIARLMASPAATCPDTIWLMRMGAGTYDPDDEMLDALEAHRVRVGHWESGPTEIIGLRKLAADAIACKVPASRLSDRAARAIATAAH